MQPELPDDKWRIIFEREILPVLTRGASSQEHPIAVFVAGQPGSGKTTMADLIHSSMQRRGGAVRIGSDQYKTADPRYLAALAEDVRTAGTTVRSATHKWQEEAEAHTRAHRHDAVVEVALKDPEKFRRTAAAFRDAGFRVEIVALAVPEALSQLGLLERFVAEAVEENAGRYVSWDNHDACATGMLHTLATVEAEQSVDRITVVRRDWKVLYENELVGGIWRRQPGADQAVVQERSKPLSAQETEQFLWRLAHAEQRRHRELNDENRRLAVGGFADRAAALAEPIRRVAQLSVRGPGIDYHGLSAAEHRRIFERDVLSELGLITPQEQPIAVYVVGQPGAGMTDTADNLRLVRHNATHISEKLQELHPDYHNLLDRDHVQHRRRFVLITKIGGTQLRNM